MPKNNVVELHKHNDPDEALRASMGQGLKTMMVVGWDNDGELFIAISGDTARGDIVYNLEAAKHAVMFK